MFRLPVSGWRRARGRGNPPVPPRVPFQILRCFDVYETGELLEHSMLNRDQGDQVGLPFRPCLYTMDQVATMLALSERTLKDKYVYFDGLSVGTHNPNLLLARDISPNDMRDTNTSNTLHPEWRIAEQELVRWLKRKHFRIYERGWVQS